MSKSSKRRDCPAARRTLSAAECGAGRNRLFACPADCPFNPFSPAQYDLLADCEREAADRAIRRLESEGPEALAFDSGFEEAVRAGNGSGAELAVAEVFFRKRDARGTTFLERWLAEGPRDLRNDVRLILERRARSRILLLEVVRVIDDLTIEAVDHLAPGAPCVRLIDRSLAAVVCRFETVLAFGYPLPHYWRVLGGAVPLPGLDSLDGVEIVRAISAHWGGPTAPEELEAWFWLNLDRFRRSLEATFLARQRRLLFSTDAGWVRVDYTLQVAPGEALARLDGVPAVEPDTPTEEEAREGFSEARVWFEDEMSSGSPPRLAQPVLGRILIGRSTWRLQGGGEQQIERLRARFEDLLGDRVRFCSRTVDDLRPRIQMSPMPDGAEELVVPALVGEGGPMVVGSQRVRAIPGVSPEDLMARVAEEANRAFLDAPIPLLQGKTPREAALDPALRPTLLRMIKHRVCQLDEDNLRTGRADSIDWMIRDLGLTEILGEPPPPRAIHSRSGPGPRSRAGGPVAARPGGDDEEPMPLSWAERPPAPPLPAEPLSLPAALNRMESFHPDLLKPANALAELEASGSSFVDELSDLTEGRLSREESALLTACAVQLWFTLVPPGHRAPDYDLDRWEELLARTEERLAESMSRESRGADSDPLSALDLSAQPAVARLAAVTYLGGGRKRGRRGGISPEAEFDSVAILVSLVDLLDEALGRAPE